MKQYIVANQLRLVGKCWEVRHQLKKISAEAANGKTTLSEFTSSRSPQSVKQRRSHALSSSLYFKKT